MTKEKILITGGSGFIATNVARHLLDKGFEVILMDNFYRVDAKENLKVNPESRFVRGDVRFSEDFKKVGNIDFLYHTAAQPGIPVSIENPLFDFKVNALGTVNALEYCREKGASMIYCSTNKTYPTHLINNIPLKEEEKRYVFVDPNYKGIPLSNEVTGSEHSPYGCSKLAGEIYCTEYDRVLGVPTIANRMSCIAGKYQYGVAEQGWTAWWVISGMTEKKLQIFGNGKQVRDVLYAGDLAKLIEIEIKNFDKMRGVHQVGGGPENTLSLIECTEYVEKKLGIKFDISYFPWRPADHKIFIADVSALKKWWGPTTSPQATLTHIIDWYSGVLEEKGGR